MPQLKPSAETHTHKKKKQIFFFKGVRYHGELKCEGLGKKWCLGKKWWLMPKMAKKLFVPVSNSYSQFVSVWVQSQNKTAPEFKWKFNIKAGRTDAKVEAPILWPPDAKNWLIGKDTDAGKDWRRRGRQRMRWLNAVTDSMDMSLNKLRSW